MEIIYKGCFTLSFLCTQASQKGSIGITLVANWFLPLKDTKSDQKAAERAIDFMYGR